MLLIDLCARLRDKAERWAHAIRGEGEEALVPEPDGSPEFLVDVYLTGLILHNERFGEGINNWASYARQIQMVFTDLAPTPDEVSVRYQRIVSSPSTYRDRLTQAATRRCDTDRREHIEERVRRVRGKQPRTRLTSDLTITEKNWQQLSLDGVAAFVGVRARVTPEGRVEAYADGKLTRVQVSWLAQRDPIGTRVRHYLVFDAPWPLPNNKQQSPLRWVRLPLEAVSPKEQRVALQLHLGVALRSAGLIESLPVHLPMFYVQSRSRRERMRRSKRCCKIEAGESSRGPPKRAGATGCPTRSSC